jgi:hypothetical protein
VCHRGDLLSAEIAEKQARSIKYQLTIAKLPLAKDINNFDFTGTPVNDRVRGALFRPGAAVGSTGEAAAGDAVAGVLFGALRGPIDGADRIRPLFRWFVGIGIDDPVWDHSSFTKNRDRLLEGARGAEYQRPALGD